MNQQFNVDQTSFALQSMQDSVQTVQAMKAAGKELKAAFKQPELNINNIENLQDDMADMMVGLGCAGCAAVHAVPMQCISKQRSIETSVSADSSALRITVSSSGCIAVSSSRVPSGPQLQPAALRHHRVEGFRQTLLLQDMHQEIQDVLGQNFGIPDDIDEDELMEELDALEDDLTADTEANANGVPSYLQVVLSTCLQGPAWLRRSNHYLHNRSTAAPYL